MEIKKLTELLKDEVSKSAPTCIDNFNEDSTKLIEIARIKLSALEKRFPNANPSNMISNAVKEWSQHVEIMANYKKYVELMNDHDAKPIPIMAFKDMQSGHGGGTTEKKPHELFKQIYDKGIKKNSIVLQGKRSEWKVLRITPCCNLFLKCMETGIEKQVKHSDDYTLKNG